MINLHDAMAAIQTRRDDAIVLPTMTGGKGWAGVTQNRDLDLPVTGAMSKASSIGLGVALAQPDKKVIVLDGDGSLAMNLGTLITVSGKAPENLYHFVMENGVYAVTGGQPIPNSGNFSFSELAEAAGYAASFEFDDLEELTTRIDEVFDTKGPVFVTIKSIPEIEGEADAEEMHPELRPRGLPVAMHELHQTLNG